MKLVLVAASILLHMVVTAVVDASTATNLRATKKVAEKESSSAVHEHRSLQTSLSFQEYKLLHPVPSYWQAYRQYYDHTVLKACAFLEFTGNMDPQTGDKCWGASADYMCFRGEQKCASDVVPESNTHPTRRCDCNVAEKKFECSDWDPCYEPEGTIEECPATKPVGLQDTCALALTCMYDEDHCCDDSLLNRNKNVTQCNCLPDGKFECFRLTSTNVCKTVQCPSVDDSTNTDTESPTASPVASITSDARPDTGDETTLMIEPRPQQFLNIDEPEEIFLISGNPPSGVCPFHLPKEGDSCDVFEETCSYNRICCETDGSCHFTHFVQCKREGVFGPTAVLDIVCRPRIITLTPQDDEEAMLLPPAPISGDIREDKPADPWIEPGQKTVWHELEGMNCQPDAVDYINAEDNGINIVYCIPYGSVVTADFRTDRVRMFYNDEDGPDFGKIIGIPHVG